MSPKYMEQGLVVQLDAALARAAARISLTHELPMADSIKLAVARAHGATLWAQDSRLQDAEGVRFVRKE